MLNTPYIGMIRETIRLALRLRLDYYKFNWYLVGTENGYRYAAKTPSLEEIEYGDRLIAKVSDALLIESKSNTKEEPTMQGDVATTIVLWGLILLSVLIWHIASKW